MPNTASTASPLIDFENVYVSVRDKLDANQLRNDHGRGEDFGRSLSLAQRRWIVTRRHQRSVSHGIGRCTCRPITYREMVPHRRANQNTSNMNLCIEAMTTRIPNEYPNSCWPRDRDFIPVNSIPQQGKEGRERHGGAASAHLAQIADYLSSPSTDLQKPAELSGSPRAKMPRRARARSCRNPRNAAVRIVT